MERKSPFIEGFIKAANFASAAKSFGRKALGVGAIGGAAYGAGKLISETEDPEQKQLRMLRKQKRLPFQNRPAV